MNFDEHKPIYLQIADLICEKILNDAYREDERVPSIRDMGSLLGVNPNTVMRSFEYLKTIEVIYDKRGVGFFVTPGAKTVVKSIFKQSFLNEELPLIVKKVKLLDIETEVLCNHIREGLKAG